MFSRIEVKFLNENYKKVINPFLESSIRAACRLSRVEKQMAAAYVEAESDGEEYADADANMLYDSYCKKMFRDFKTQKLYENVEK